MGAALFGAVRVDAVDIDPDAVQATVLNAQANGVVLKAGLPDQVHGPYQCVLANILASPLQVLAPLLCGLVQKNGGHLVLAGILERQVELLQQAYAPWCVLGVHDLEDGWALMTARFD
jgi:ribosomal protein L11 methyltransferase